MKDKTKLPQIETRYFAVPVTIEKRDGEEDSRTIVLYAAVFDKWSKNFGGWFREKIARGAFDNCLNDEETVCLFNHDRNLVLARNKVTLDLSTDDTGLKAVFDAPNTTLGNDILEQVSRGDLREGSFTFKVKAQKWEISSSDDVEEDRTILDIEKLYDVSVVTNPQYPDTSVARRSYEEYVKEHRVEETPERDHLELELDIRKRR